MSFAIPSAIRAKARVAVPLLAVAIAAFCWIPAWTLLVTVLLVATLVEVVIELDRHGRAQTRNIYSALLLFSIVYGFIMMALLRAEEHGVWYIVLIAAQVMVCDIAAQIAGSNAPVKTPFFPSVSPNKSREGVIGGVISSVLAGTIVTGIWGAFNLKAPVLVPVIILFLAPFAAVFGDLLESKVKRQLGIKDFSKALGQATGGFADRFDGLTFAFAVFGPLVIVFG